MNYGCERLFPDERQALINALRRDIENQRDKAVRYPLLADYHHHNVRMNIRIIEAFGDRFDAM
jgi:hypothetical protein